MAPSSHTALLELPLTAPPELLDLTCVPPEDAPELPLTVDVPPELEPGTTPLLRGSAAPLDEFVCSPPLLEVTATLPEESSV